jgi:phosphoribosylformylglycinamidine cyclo-ligase
MPRSRVVDNAKIRPGDVIVGLASFGQATYETIYNGGMGSNGLTSARHDCLNKTYAFKYPESFDDRIPDSLVYTGNRSLTDPSEVPGTDIGKLILSPTRTYAPVIRAILQEHQSQVHGIIHCSGGAQTKVLHFVDSMHVIKDNLFPIPPLFEMIREESRTPLKEMYQVFNMGHRMELYVPESIADELVSISASFGIEARIVGRCEASESKRLSILTGEGCFEY